MENSNTVESQLEFYRKEFIRLSLELELQKQETSKWRNIVFGIQSIRFKVSSASKTKIFNKVLTN